VRRADAAIQARREVEDRLFAKEQECDGLARRAERAEAQLASMQRKLKTVGTRIGGVGGGGGGVVGGGGGLVGVGMGPGGGGGAGGGGDGGEALRAQLGELEEQNQMLKQMVRSQKAEARTKELQNAQLRKRVPTERRVVPLTGQAAGGSSSHPSSADRSRAPSNVMQVLQ